MGTGHRVSQVMGSLALAMFMAGCIGDALRGPFEDRSCALPPPTDRPEVTPCAIEAGVAYAEYLLGNGVGAPRISVEPGQSSYDGPSYAGCLRTPSACDYYVGTPKWGVALRLRSPDQPFFNQSVGVKVAVNGTVFREHSSGVPDCVANPGECWFIDEVTARALAVQVGLPEGIRPWKTSLHWHAEGTYVWSVEAVEEDGGATGNGKTAQFDANDGSFRGLFSYFWVS